MKNDVNTKNKRITAKLMTRRRLKRFELDKGFADAVRFYDRQLPVRIERIKRALIRKLNAE